MYEDFTPNSVFNASYHNLRFMDNEELLQWLQSEGLLRMPPVIQVLADRLEDLIQAKEDVDYYEEQLADLSTDIPDRHVEDVTKLENALYPAIQAVADALPPDSGENPELTAAMRRLLSFDVTDYFRGYADLLDD